MTTDMVPIDENDARALVLELWQRVDGGFCEHCTGQAIEALTAVFPQINWDAHWSAILKGPHA